MRGIDLRRFILAIASTLALAACDAPTGLDEGEDIAENSDAQQLIDLSLHCMNGYDRLGKFYMSVSEIEDDPAEAAKMREEAAAHLEVINAFESYAENRAAEAEVADADYQVSADAASAWYDEKYEAQEFEDFLATVVAEVEDCKTELEAGTFG